MLVRHLKTCCLSRNKDTETSYLRDLSNRITRIHLSNGPFLKYKYEKSREIYNLFIQAFYLSPNTFEKLKTILSSEELDLLDLPDLLDDLHPLVSSSLQSLFLMNYKLSDSFLYHTQSITDLDCTFVENGSAGQVIYSNKEVVYGVAPLHKALTRNGSTCLTVVSARPTFIEAHSLLSNRKRLKEVGIHHYSFESGEIDGTILFLNSQLMRKQGNIQKANELLLRAAISFADLKFKCYLRLKKAFPLSTFVFTGDDTQGDYIFAFNLVNDNPKNFAIIRKIAHKGEDVSPFSPVFSSAFSKVCEVFASSTSSRILYVESYYEAICKIPNDILTPCLRKRAASLAVEEYFNRYLPNYKNFENRLEAYRRDTKWIEDLFVVSN